MNSRSIQAVLRSLATSAPLQSDAELLRKFVSERDERAFTALVHRHGRLVWAVCRHLTRSDADADDAFQATFLVLVRNAAKVRDASKLSSWLHGVANKICAKSRESGKRRAAREQASALHHRNGGIVADSAWDRALAAVHEEVSRLPEKLRAPFVLCCLESVSVTDAAEQLGCKLSTLSARLVRAKNALQARLEGRGVAIGVAAATVAVTAGSANSVPAAVLVKAVLWVRAGGAIPDSILQLSNGVMTMSVNKMKFLAAGVFVACGLGLGGVRWVANADAQDTSKPLQKGPAPIVRGAVLPPPVQSPRAENDAILIGQRTRDQLAVGQTTRWDYDFVLASEMGTTQFIKYLQDRESRGWEFNGQVTLEHDGRLVPHWIFRQPRGLPRQSGDSGEDPVRNSAPRPEYQPSQKYNPETRPERQPSQPHNPGVWSEPREPQPTIYNPSSEKLVQTATRKEIEAEIKRLQEQLNRVDKGEPLNREDSHAFRLAENIDQKSLRSFTELLIETSAKRFGAGALSLTLTNKGSELTLIGSPEAVKWATEVVEKMYGQQSPTR